MYVAYFEMYHGNKRFLTKEELVEMLCNPAWLSPIYFKKNLQSEVIGCYGGKYVFRIISAEEWHKFMIEITDGFIQDLQNYLGELDDKI